MKFLLLLLMLFLASSCDKTSAEVRRQTNEKQYAINVVTQKVANQLKNTTELAPCGFGSQAMHRVAKLCLSFFYYKSTNVEGGRRLLITAVDEFVASVNSDEQIRPYLKNYPFEPKNIEIRIFLRNSKGQDPPLGELYDVTAINGIFLYKIIDPEGRLVDLYKETYDEALLRAAGNTAGLPELQRLPPHKPPDPNKKIGIGFCS